MPPASFLIIQRHTILVASVESERGIITILPRTRAQLLKTMVSSQLTATLQSINDDDTSFNATGPRRVLNAVHSPSMYLNG